MLSWACGQLLKRYILQFYVILKIEGVTLTCCLFSTKLKPMFTILYLAWLNRFRMVLQLVPMKGHDNDPNFIN